MNYDDVEYYIHNRARLRRGARDARYDEINYLIYNSSHKMTDEEIECAKKASNVNTAVQFGFKLNQ